MTRQAVLFHVAPDARLETLSRRLPMTRFGAMKHLRILEESGYVAIEKSFRARRPLTQARLTPAGEQAFRVYLDAIGKLAGLGD